MSNPVSFYKSIQKFLFLSQSFNRKSLKLQIEVDFTIIFIEIICMLGYILYYNIRVKQFTWDELFDFLYLYHYQYSPEENSKINE